MGTDPIATRGAGKVQVFDVEPEPAVEQDRLNEMLRREGPRRFAEEGYPMTTPGVDQRSPARQARDEQIVAEPPLAPPDLPPEAVPSSVEAHLGRLRRRPLAVAGVVENGLVRPLDPAVKLPEHSRVIIVASEAM